MRLTLLVLAVPLISGCSLFYSNSYHHEHFTIYSNRDQDVTDCVGMDAERLFEIFEYFFDVQMEKHLTISLKGSGTKAAKDRVDTLMGYYLPYWHFISIDTTNGAVFKDGEVDRSVVRYILAHEMAHYFILSKFPEVQNKSWLNEGLAGVFEVVLFDDEHAELPYLNPTLFYTTLHTFFNDIDEVPSLAELTEMSWGEFHKTGAKSKHYALAWSLCMYLIVIELPREMTFSEKIEAIIEMEPEDFAAMHDDWLRFFITFDVRKLLRHLAESTDLDLTPAWAQKELDLLEAKEED